jgi:nitroreductase
VRTIAAMDPKATFDVLFRRRSIRNYTARPVEREKVVQLLQAAMAAPTALNIQPWEFIVIDGDTFDRVRRSIPRGGGYNAPMAIVVASYGDWIPWKDDGLLDCAAAIENLLIAAPALGLGTVWVGGFDAATLRGILDMPDNVRPIAVIYVGYPAESHPPRTQYVEEAVYWGKYDKTRPHPPRPGSLLAK